MNSERGVVFAYVSDQCPNCIRLCKTLRRLQLPEVRVVKIDGNNGRTIDGLTAVPTIVDGTDVLVGTKAFEWLHRQESRVPLDAYASVIGEGTGGLPYTDMDADETVFATPFTSFGDET